MEGGEDRPCLVAASEGAGPCGDCVPMTDGDSDGSEIIPLPRDHFRLLKNKCVGESDVHLRGTCISNDGDSKSTEVPTDGCDGCSSVRVNDSDDSEWIPDMNTAEEACSSDGDDNLDGDPESDGDETHSAGSSVTVMHTSNNDGLRCWNKYHYCLYCHESYAKLPRHMMQVHSRESRVAHIMSFDVKSKERKILWDLIRNEGDHIHNLDVLEKHQGEIIPAKRPGSWKVSVSDYLPCEFCLGWYVHSDLWKHQKICAAYTTKDKKWRKVQTRSAMLLPMSAECSERMKANVLSKMKHDDISFIVRGDQLIMKFGEHLYKKLGHDSSQHTYISQKMRELARLLQILRKEKSAKMHLHDYVRPRQFDAIIAGVRRVAEYCPETGQYGIPSLALKLGHSLRRCALICKAEAIKSEDRIGRQEAEEFYGLTDSEWSSDVSKHALTTLYDKKRNKQQLLPLAEDVSKLQKHLQNVVKETTSILEKDKTCQGSWSTLAQATLSQMVLFNRKRSGEVGKMKVSDVSRLNTAPACQDIIKSLSPWERDLHNKLTRVEIKGKRGRTVPVLLTKSVKDSLALLLSCRRDVGIHEHNKFFFAKVHSETSHYRGSDALRKFACSCGANSPELLTSTRLRKHVATLSQVLCLKDNELDILANFLGHDIRTHREYYRLPEQITQTVKVSQILMAMEEGNLQDFRGKTLDEIAATAGGVHESSPGETSRATVGSISDTGCPGSGPSKGRDGSRARGVHKSPSRETVGSISDTGCTRPGPSKGRDGSRARGVHGSSPDETSKATEGFSDTGCTRPGPSKGCDGSRARGVKRPWSDDEIKAIKTRRALVALRLPGKADIEELQRQHPVLKARSWRNIKDYFRNNKSKLLHY